MDRGSISIYPEYELTKNYSLREKLLSKTLDRQTDRHTQLNIVSPIVFTHREYMFLRGFLNAN